MTRREARSEGEALRLRLAQAESRVAELQVRVYAVGFSVRSSVAELQVSAKP